MAAGSGKILINIQGFAKQLVTEFAPLIHSNTQIEVIDLFARTRNFTSNAWVPIIGSMQDIRHAIFTCNEKAIVNKPTHKIHA